MNRDVLLEAALASHRDRDAEGRLRNAPAWWDLDPAAREQLFALQIEQRALERAIDADGWSTTVRAVLRAIPRNSA
jgi:hypothetical protein